MNFNIEAVNPKTRTFDSKYGSMVSYQVKFVGNDNAVEVTRKSSSPAPKAGDALEGTIDVSGEYGPKFKAEYANKSFGGAGSKPAYIPKDEKAIQAMWSIGQAVVLHNATNTGTKVEIETIEALAIELFGMVDSVKAATVASVEKTEQDNSFLGGIFPDIEVVEEKELPWGNS